MFYDVSNGLPNCATFGTLCFIAVNSSYFLFAISSSMLSIYWSCIPLIVPVEM